MLPVHLSHSCVGDILGSMQVCDQLGVPLTTVPLTKQYWERVVSHCVEQIHHGRTPNPDVLCNSRVKFGAFFEYLQRHPAQFDRVASGHYARVDSGPCVNELSPSAAISEGPHGTVRTIHRTSTGCDHKPPCVQLKLTPDSWKDQTYFLANLSQQQLQQVLFPLGHLTKKTVRDLAAAAQLPTMTRKDSQGICFLGKVRFGEFIKVSCSHTLPKCLLVRVALTCMLHIAAIRFLRRLCCIVFGVKVPSAQRCRSLHACCCSRAACMPGTRTTSFRRKFGDQRAMHTFDEVGLVSHPKTRSLPLQAAT